MGDKLILLMFSRTKINPQDGTAHYQISSSNADFHVINPFLALE